MPVIVNATSKQITDALSRDHTHRVIIFKRDGCPNCQRTMADAVEPMKDDPDVTVLTHDVDDRENLLARLNHDDASMLRASIAGLTSLPFTIHVAPDNGVRVIEGPYNHKDLLRFLQSI